MMIELHRRKSNSVVFAHSKDSYQPGYSPNLITLYAVHRKNAYSPYIILWKQLLFREKSDFPCEHVYHGKVLVKIIVGIKYYFVSRFLQFLYTF